MRHLVFNSPVVNGVYKILYSTEIAPTKCLFGKKFRYME